MFSKSSFNPESAATILDDKISKERTQYDKQSKERENKHKQETAKFMKEREKICQSLITTLEDTITEMGKTGSINEALTFDHNKNSMFITKNLTHYTTRDANVTDLPCAMKIREHFNKYKIKTEFKNFSSVPVVLYDTKHKFTIELPHTNVFIQQYVNKSTKPLELSDTKTLEYIYGKYKP